VCAWGGPPGGQLGRQTDVGRRERRATSDASPRQRHVLAAPAKGIISGRRPTTQRQWGEADAWCCAAAAAACSMIHEPIERVWAVAGWCIWCIWCIWSIWSNDPSAPALIARSGAPCGRAVVGAAVSERVEEEGSKVVVLLRYDVVPCGPCHGPISAARGAGTGPTAIPLRPSCVVARAAGKPSCWPMGSQARSGAGVTLRLRLASP
jgi:hypothetical protein